MLVNNEAHINVNGGTPATSSFIPSVAAENVKVVSQSVKRRSTETEWQEAQKETNKLQGDEAATDKAKGKLNITADNNLRNSPEEKETKEVNPKKMEEASRLVIEALRLSHSNVEIRVHEDSGRYQIRKVDQESGEVILEIPPEKLLKIAAMIKEQLNEVLGLIVDETA